jgi:FdhE protein
MTAATAALDDLTRRRAEWAPWLAVVAEVLREIGRPEWDAAVPTGMTPRDPVPRLAGAAIAIHPRSVRRFLERLVGTASQGNSPKMSTLRGTHADDVDALQLFAASVCQDTSAIAASAGASGIDAEALQAIAALLAVPFLHACARRFAASSPPGWVQGYCPLCGSWPAFVEVRGIERTRSNRCGRCGGEWHARALCCPYCQMIDHDELVSLVPEKVSSGLNATIEACNRCRGYVKTFTTLQGCPAANVIVEDLGSVELDVAALEHGYSRPVGAGYDLAISVTGKVGSRRLFGWTS